MTRDTMSGLKLRLTLLAFLLCMTAQPRAQSTAYLAEIKIDKPTVVAFFPNGRDANSEDADLNEALGDFELYAGRVEEPLSRLGIHFSQQYGSSVRIHTGRKSIVFTCRRRGPCYYFLSPGKKVHIEYGVLTDTYLLEEAQRYFNLRPKDE